ncbi:MAG: hypothetical protein GTO41_07470, partial [Burkholderiales bacterium]|nr:hypothetical protein [Burkholderiales bacterium]
METRRTEHWRATLAVALLASLIPLQTARAEGAVDFGPIADQAIIDLQTYIGIDTVN